MRDILVVDETQHNVDEMSPDVDETSPNCGCDRLM
jgi:hypothetical protein